jgi:hypothetical protein
MKTARRMAVLYYLSGLIVLSLMLSPSVFANAILPEEEPNISVAFTVLDNQGKPIKYLHVLIVQVRNSSPVGARNLITGDDGRVVFEITAIPEGARYANVQYQIYSESYAAGNSDNENYKYMDLFDQTVRRVPEGQIVEVTVNLPFAREEN